MAARIKTICCIHGTLAQEFRRLGLRTFELAPPAGTASLPELLAGLPEPPDCVIQEENLGCRLVLTELDAAPCPTLFWALDPHLNLFWQRHYAGLFSAVASSQPHLVPAFAAAGAARAAWITWHGHARPFVPHAARRASMAFVGRVTSQRRRRRWFADHMARHGLVIRDGLSGPQLAAVYDDARLAPNECIAGEVNQRLFEAASSGCLPVSERAPEAVAELFAPDREALYFDDVLELDERIRFALAHPGLTEKMALAAHAAVAARHLPAHRAGQFLALAGSAGTGARGGRAREGEALALYRLRRAGQLPLRREDVWKRLLAAPATPDIVAARLHLALAAGDRDTVLGLGNACLAEASLRSSVRVMAAASLAAWRLEETRTARMLCLAWTEASGFQAAARPASHHDHLLFFASALAAEGLVASPGMVFDPGTHLPDDAAQCLLAAKALRPDALETDRRLEALMRRLPGAEAERVGLLSGLTLHRRDDWSLGLELGLANLRSFRREAGLEELALAGATAGRLGQGERFARRLALADPSGRLRAALGGA